MWQWDRSADGETAWEVIDGATSASRSPNPVDVGNYLRASVTYTDMFGEGKTASVVTANAVEGRTVANASPSFKDQDETGPEVDDDDNPNDDAREDNIIVSRMVDENVDVGSSVGDAVSASDPDNDVLIYTLEDGVETDNEADSDDNPATSSSRDGDSTSFTIDSSSAQIKTAVELNYEAATPQISYSVTVIATDPSGAATRQIVTIALGDVNEAPAFDTASKGLTTLTVTEVTTPDGTVDDLDGNPDLAANQSMYQATDEDIIVDAAETVTYRVSGTDAKYFTITEGALSFRVGGRQCGPTRFGASPELRGEEFLLDNNSSHVRRCRRRP